MLRYKIKFSKNTPGMTRWQSRRTCTHLLLQELQNYSLLLNNLRQENVGSHHKKIRHVQGQRRSPSKIVGGAKSCLNKTPYPSETLGLLKQTLCTPGPRDPTETEPELCLSVSCGGTGQQWPTAGAGALGAADLGMA